MYRIVRILLCVLLAASQVLIQHASDVFARRGRITKPDTSIIDLDTNVTFFLLECTLDNFLVGSSDISMLEINQTKNGVNRKIETQVNGVNSKLAKIDLTNETELCGVNRYFCFYKDKPVVEPKSVYVGRKARMVSEDDILCISENRKYLTCDFTAIEYCDLPTIYTLSVARSGSLCALHYSKDLNLWRFNSSTKRCEYQSAHKEITMKLESENKFGKTAMNFTINNYDLLRPGLIENFKIFEITTRSVLVEWSLPKSPMDAHRLFEFQFSDQKQTHTIEDLLPFTRYKLQIRSRLALPKARNFEDVYWSDWVSTVFATEACAPELAPLMIPGGYSIRKRINNRITVDVYWKGVPEQFWNGPEFGYDVEAISSSGVRIQPKVVLTDMATFENLAFGSYRVEVTSRNALGRAKLVGSTTIFLSHRDQRPIIKRVSRKENFHQISWYPLSDNKTPRNYTLLFCDLDHTGSCTHALGFQLIRNSSSSVNFSSEYPMNFALAANYEDHSSSLTWTECIVEQYGGVDNPDFDLGNISHHSFVVYIKDRCEQKSWIQKYDIEYWPVESPQKVQNVIVMPYNDVIVIGQLHPDTRYNVSVTSIDDAGIPMTSYRIITTQKKVPVFPIFLYTILGSALIILAALRVMRYVKRVKNIKVDLPIGLEEIFEPVKLDNPFCTKNEKSNVHKQVIFNDWDESILYDEECEDEPEIETTHEESTIESEPIKPTQNTGYVEANFRIQNLTSPIPISNSIEMETINHPTEPDQEELKAENLSEQETSTTKALQPLNRPVATGGYVPVSQVLSINKASSLEPKAQTSVQRSGYVDLNNLIRPQNPLV
ncbi:cytokine receptor-like isoform X2 [Uranotaenia lowii]|uniref:cytokine receptor-like isoform X2 n=1 Tax=Uranotaenia lowii TaxID=190385 RepID=UPI00247971D1|nr:cytokine receptor-like isoform X2 [Uranotaenia lowii]